MKTNFLQIFKGKKILVTGGTGSIGSEITLHLTKYKPFQIRIYSRDETKQLELQQKITRLAPNIDVRFLIGDIRDKERLDKAFGEIDIVFHTAALKHVPFCEYNPFEAVKTNIYGTQNVIDLAIRHNVSKVIGISTDKAVNPSSFMGATKLMMEKMFLSTRWYLGESLTKFSIVRFGNVLDSRGSVTQLWKKQIELEEPLSITDPRMARYFISIGQAIGLIFEATRIMHGHEIFILKMQEKKVTQLASEFFHRYHKKKTLNLNIKFTGRRAGEKDHEEIMTDDERKKMLDLDNIYIVIPYEDLYGKRKKTLYIR